MTDTVHLGLPLIEAAQAQKHVTHNEALIALDALVQLAVLDRDLAAPPALPAEGDRYVVAAAATGAWAGHDHEIAVFAGGGWSFRAPRPGFLAYVADENLLALWTGASWIDAAATVAVLQNLVRLGLGTAADATNPLAARLNNALFMARPAAEGGDGDLRLKLSKEGAADTVSLLFQTAFSGRAEIGLAGDDDLRVKVSSDGSTWREALRVERASGRVTFPCGGAREVLTAERTYYVRTDGDDGNDGLADSPAGAFRTVQRAIDAAAALDLSVFNVAIQVGPGTYAQPLVLRSLVSSGGNVTIKGDSGTPANVVIDGNGATCIDASLNVRGIWLLDGLKLITSAGHGIVASGGGLRLNIRNIDFGDVTVNHITIQLGATVQATGNYMISGDASRHVHGTMASKYVCESRTVTLTGTPAFAVAWAVADTASVFSITDNTFTGSATGVRYDVNRNAVINTGGATLPGDTAGTDNGGEGHYY